jgi:uncharacterized protein YbjQ (UPF0145 family)
MRFYIVADTDDGERRFIDDFASEARARELLPKRGFRPIAIREASEGDEADLAAAAAGRTARDAEKLGAIILTTSFQVAGAEIVREIEIVSAECSYGMNFFRDLSVAARDLVGGRSESMQKVLRDARRTVLTELRAEAFAVGADAVIAVDLDYQTINDGKMLMLVASGTAVKITRLNQ